MDISQDIFSFFDDADLAELMASDAPETRQLFESTLGAKAVAEAIKDRAQAKRESDGPIGLAKPKIVNPDLPEIVLLHGITDSHLVNTARRHNRIWLDYLELLKGRFTRYLTLQSDGVSDQPGVALETDGPISKKYQPALDAWNENGFATHMFCYDWRKSVCHAADQLNSFLQKLPAVAENRKVVLVCHSMGGLVASAYAARHDHWELVIERAVFVGSPLGGAYSAAVAIMGKSPSFKKMGLLSLTESLEDFQRMAASFPGLVDLLPNPEIFPAAADLYSQSGWPGKVKPAQQWLDDSKSLKQVIWNSPLFSRSTHLISQDFPTVSEMPWNAQHNDRDADVTSPLGDGAVLSQSSLVPELTAFKIPGAHAMLVVEPDAIDAVMQIAKGEQPDLPSASMDQTRNLAGSGADGPVGLAAPRQASTSNNANHSATTNLDVMANELQSKSDGTRGALLGLTANTGDFKFDRLKLRAGNAFSWANSLSLAIASEAAYKSGQSLRKIVTDEWGFDDMQEIEAGTHQGFLTWDEETVLLSFRGTETNIRDWLGNFRISGTKWTVQGRDLGEIHHGFLTGFNGLKPKIDSILSTINTTNKKLWITGHSLGGALAVLAGAQYVSNFSVAGVYTYGQPKVGGDLLNHFYREKLDRQYVRFVNNEDPVPMVPPGYQHGGHLIWFDENGDFESLPSEPDGPRGLAQQAMATQATAKELSAEDFERLQQALSGLDVEPDPDTPRGLALPSFGLRDRLREMLGISFSDHSVRDAYIPIIKRHLQEERTG